MIECNIKPYEGWDSYIYVDYCEDDVLRAYPVIERLGLEGLPVWYRNGNNEEETLDRLSRSDVCVFIVSQQALDKHAVLSKLIISIGNHRPTAVIKMGKLDATVGVMMQMELASSFDLTEESSYDAFLRFCERQVDTKSKGKPTDDQLRRWRERASGFLELYQENMEAKKRKKGGFSVFPNPINLDEPSQNNTEATEVNPEEERGPSALIVRLLTGEIYAVTKPLSKIGRHEKADIVINGTTAISRFHAILEKSGGQYYLRDDQGRNGTYLDGQELMHEERKELHNGSVFCLAKEDFCFVTGTKAEQIWKLSPEDRIKAAKEFAIMVLQSNSARNDGPIHSEPIPDGPVHSEPIPDGPVHSEPIPDGPIHSEPILDGPIHNEPISDGPIHNEPIPDGPIPGRKRKMENDGPESDDEETIRSEKKEIEVPEEDNERTVWDDMIEEMTVRVPLIGERVSDKGSGVLSEYEDEETVSEERVPAGIVRLKTGELFHLPQIENVIGRSTKHKQADIKLEGNSEISRRHAVIYQFQKKFLLRDCGSMFGTYIGDTKVEAEQAAELSDQTIFSLANEQFLFLIDKSLAAVSQAGKLFVLKSEITGESRVLLGEPLLLDRKHPWKDNLLSDTHISRHHAELLFDNGSYSIRDVGSINGTYVNRKMLESGGSTVTLKDGDRVSVYNLEFRFTELELK